MQDANNPIMLDDIFKVFSQHVADMAQYEGYVLAIDDAIRFFNHETVEAGFANIENQEGIYRTGTGVKEEIENVLGEEGKQYFLRLIEDLNRSKQSQSDFKFADKFFSRNKAQAVLANSRVVAQQPTAYVRAGEVISYKYLSKAASLNPATLKKYSDLSKEQSSLAWYKSKGYYETFIGQDIQEIITGTANLKDRINDAMGAAASLADDLTWGMLYRASMLKVEDSKAYKDGKLKKDSEEYYNKVNKIFHEIIIKTQVVDTTLTKSQVMRNQDGASKLLTSFGAEPTKNFNILLRGFADGQQGKGWKRFKRAVGVYVYTNLLVSIVTSIIDAWRDNEDDDEFYFKILLE